MSRDQMQPGNRQRLEESEKKWADAISLSPIELALYSDGHGMPGSRVETTYEKLVMARCAQVQADALHELAKATRELAEAQEESGKEMARLTSSNRWAGWAMVGLTAAIVVTGILQLLNRT